MSDKQLVFSCSLSFPVHTFMAEVTSHSLHILYIEKPHPHPFPTQHHVFYVATQTHLHKAFLSFILLAFPLPLSLFVPHAFSHTVLLSRANRGTKNCIWAIKQ